MVPHAQVAHAHTRGTTINASVCVATAVPAGAMSVVIAVYISIAVLMMIAVIEMDLVVVLPFCSVESAWISMLKILQMLNT